MKFNKKNKEELIVKRNWKKIGIWSSVAAVLVAGLVPAIYFPIVLNQDHGEPVPSGLEVKSVDGMVDAFNSKAEDEVWGIYIDIKDNDDSDFALHSFKDPETDKFDKSEFNGPFGTYLKDNEELTTQQVDWYSFFDVTTEDATEYLAEFMFKAYATEGSDRMQESYYYIPVLDDTEDWIFDSTADQKELTVIYSDKSETDDNEVYDLTYQTDADDQTTINGPMWLTFVGNDLKFMVGGITSTKEGATQTQDFHDLVEETRK